MSIQATTSTSDGAVKSGSLREALEIRRVRREIFSMRDAVSIVVPLCTQLAELHAAGRRFLVHPSALMYGKAGTELDLDLANELPTHIRDRATIAPESRRGEKGDACASVFSIGAILYELCTGEIVGPGMKRPREAMPSLPPQFEVLLGKALVGDPKHRPHDLAALAQALHHLAPTGSMPPPPADESHLDHDAGFDVDVSLSMLPPEPVAAAYRLANGGPAGPASQSNGNGHVVQAQVPPPPSSRAMGDGYGLAAATASQPHMRLEDPTVRLAQLKEQLESDPRPRYVVVKDGMDHGLFNAVELLQQIASHQFIGAHPLRDTLSGEEKPIEEWSDFALFARHAGLNREIKQERKALEGVVAAESHRTQWKALVGATLLGVIVAAGAAWWLRERSRSQYEQTVRDDKATNVDSDAALSAAKGEGKGPGGVSRGGTGGGSFPQVAGGGSCEAAIAKYTEDYSQQGVPPDLTAGSYAGVLNKGTYLNSCGVPSNMSVSICAAVQNGRAVGVTVVTTPSSPGHASCVRGAVMGMGFPAHPRMDVARTTFAAN
jgi:eukaryotic-like serine/threonine-protein kinase